MQAFNRRAFLKGTGTLALAAAASGLLCGAAEVPTEAVLGAVDGILVHSLSVRISNDWNENYFVEAHFMLENTNSTTAIFHIEHFSASSAGKTLYKSGLNKWNGSHYIQDIQLEPGEQQLISASFLLEHNDLDSALQDGMRFTFQHDLQSQTFVGRPLFGKYGGEFTAEPVQTLTFPTVGGLRVHSVRVTLESDSSGRHFLSFDCALENTYSDPVELRGRNFVLQIGDERIDKYLSVWNLGVNRYYRTASIVPVAPGVPQTVNIQCYCSADAYKRLTRHSDPEPWKFTLLYGQERLSFTGYAASPDTYSVGETQSTALPSVGGIQLSDLSLTDYSTQNKSYSLLLHFTMQNLTDAQIDLPIPALHPNDNLPNHFTLQFDGTEKYVYGPFSCEYYDDGDGQYHYWPKSLGAFEALAPHESQLAELAVSLTEREHTSLYTQNHTVALTFTCNGESLTIHLDPRTGVFYAV